VVLIPVLNISTSLGRGYKAMKSKLVNISVNLPESYLKIMWTLVKEGNYASRSEVVREALKRYLDLDLNLKNIIDS
jgi:metal-responsive CopG/Arc/MetJ family transcriptional regulator